MIKCNTCGAVNDNMVVYCTHCGKKIPRFCTYCGAEINPGMNYCGQCGEFVRTAQKTQDQEMYIPNKGLSIAAIFASAALIVFSLCIPWIYAVDVTDQSKNLYISNMVTDLWKTTMIFDVLIVLFLITAVASVVILFIDCFAVCYTKIKLVMATLWIPLFPLAIPLLMYAMLNDDLKTKLNITYITPHIGWFLFFIMYITFLLVCAYLKKNDDSQREASAGKNIISMTMPQQYIEQSDKETEELLNNMDTLN